MEIENEKQKYVLEFYSLKDACEYAYENYYGKPFSFVCNRKSYETKKVDRYWLCKLVPSMYYDLYDELPEIENDYDYDEEDFDGDDDYD